MKFFIFSSILNIFFARYFFKKDMKEVEEGEGFYEVPNLIERKEVKINWIKNFVITEILLLVVGYFLS